MVTLHMALEHVVPPPRQPQQLLLLVPSLSAQVLEGSSPCCQQQWPLEYTLILAFLLSFCPSLHSFTVLPGIIINHLQDSHSFCLGRTHRKVILSEWEACLYCWAQIEPSPMRPPKSLHSVLGSPLPLLAPCFQASTYKGQKAILNIRFSSALPCSPGSWDSPTPPALAALQCF